MDKRDDRKAGRMNAARAVPAPPDYFSDEQRQVWAAFVGELGPGVDRYVLEIVEAYVVERARWLESEAFLREHGTVYVLRSDMGEVKSAVPAPHLAIAAKAQERALALAAELKRWAGKRVRLE